MRAPGPTLPDTPVRPGEASALTAADLLYSLAPDTLYFPAQAHRRLGLAGVPDPAHALQAGLAAGWLTQEATGEVGYAARCYLPAHRTTAPAAPLAPPAAETFSYFRGGIRTVQPYAAITPAQLHEVLVGTRHAAHTAALRAAPAGSAERDALKRALDYVTPAGTFARRANEALVQASGLLVLDFDHLPDVPAARAALLADELVGPELVLLFTSPGGDGLKALVRTDPTAEHGANFRAYADYLRAHYAPLGLCPDEAGKDVARACFVPHAPDAWLSPRYRPAA